MAENILAPIKGRKVVPFVENAIYDVVQTAEICHRSTRVIRALCNTGRLRARRDRGGFLITGYAIRDYVECRCELKQEAAQCK